MFKGINQDIHPKYAKESYNYALNTNVEKEDTAYPFINSDFGNSPCVKVDGRILGHCIDKDNNFIVFTNKNKIYRIVDCNVTELSYGRDYSCLNLGQSEFVECVYTLIRGCEELVYFTDNKSKYKVINLSNLPNNCDEMLYSPNLAIPNIQVSTITGGSVYAGNYFYTLRYLDAYGTPTNWLLFNDAISVYSNTKTTLEGNICKTNKSIQFSVTNLDKKYTGYQIGVIEYSSFSKAISKVFILPENVNTYTGTNEITTTSVNELLVNNLVVETVGTHTKHLNRLFIGNLSYTDYNWAVIQKAANNIKLKYTVEKFPKDAPVRTFRHNDVYDFAVVGRFANGKTTPAFHIPGRVKNPDLTESNNAGTNHITSNITNNIDTIKIANDLNISICKDCTPINLTYLAAGGIELNEIQIYIEHLTVYSNAAVTIDINYGKGVKKQYKTFQVVGNGNVKTKFIYEGTNVFEVTYTIKSNDCTWQKTINVFYDDLAETGDIQLTSTNVVDKDIEAWRIFNTALKDKHPLDRFKSSGKFGYWEVCERYPDTKDCNGVPIYPHTTYIDALGQTQYLMDYIRYHRMPDQVLEPIQDDNNIYRLGFYYNLNNFKQQVISLDPKLADVVSWEVVYAERNNPIVKDTGLMYNAINPKDNGPVKKLGIGDDDLLASLPKTSLFQGNKTIMGSSSFRDPKTFVYFSPNTLYNERLEGSIVNICSTYQNTIWDVGSIYSKFKQPPSKINSILDTDLYFAYTNIWKSVFTPGNFLYGNLENIKLVSPVKHIQDDDGGEYLGVSSNLGGITVRNMLYSNNVGFLRFTKNVTSDKSYLIDLLDYGTPYTFQNTVYHNNKEGDAWISNFRFTIKQPGFIYPNNWDTVLSLGTNQITSWISDGVGDNIERETYFKAIIDIWIESDINCSYRFNGTNAWETFYTGSNAQSFLDADKKKIGGTTEEDITWEYFPDYNEVNPDYSQLYSPSTFYKLSPNYDYCSDCNQDLYNRIYYSEATYLENNKDNMREIKVNNYQDLENSINTLFKDKDELYARTKKHVYKLFTRETEIKADNTNIFIGTNQLLSIPAQRTASTEYVYGGAEHKLDIISTEYGTFYISDNHIIHLTDQVKILEEGLRGFLKDNLRSSLPTQYKYSLAYDSRYNRLFITKLEYVPLYRNIVYKNGAWYQDTGNLDIYIPQQTENKAMFENKSFTLSYNMRTDSFVSFHSWIPDYTLFNNKHYYSQKGDTVYKHNTDNYLNYYNKDYTQVIDIPINKNNVGESTPITEWTNVAYTQDINTPTFKSYIAYNENQSTGIVDLIPKTTIFNYHNLTKVENIYTFNIDRNKTNIPLFSTNWLDTLNDYPIDKVTLPKNIIGTFNESLRSSYLNVRLFYNNYNKIVKERLSFDLISTLQINSIR